MAKPDQLGLLVTRTSLSCFDQGVHILHNHRLLCVDYNEASNQITDVTLESKFNVKYN